jgi:FOG: TPR repeat
MGIIPIASVGSLSFVVNNGRKTTSVGFTMHFVTSKIRISTGTAFGAIALASSIVLAIAVISSVVKFDEMAQAAKLDAPMEAEFVPCQSSDTYAASDERKEFVHRWLDLLFNEDTARRNIAEAKKMISPTAWKKVECLASRSKVPTYIVSSECAGERVTSFPTIVGLTAEEPYLPLMMQFSVSVDKGSCRIDDVAVDYYDGRGWIDATAQIDKFFKSGMDIGLTNEARGHYLAANYLLSKRDRKAAIEAYGKAIKASPKFFLAYFCRGYERSTLGDHKGAIEDYSSAIAINPRFVGALHNRGYEFDKFQKEHKLACMDFAAVIRLDPDHPSGYRSRAQSLCALDDMAGVVRDCDKALQLCPNDGCAFSLRAYAHTKLGDKRCAIADATKAIENYENTAWTYTLRGNAEMAIGLYDDAMNDFEHAIRVDSNFARGYLSRGHLRNMTGDHKGALADLDRAVLMNSNSAFGYYFRGLTQASLGNHRSAIADFTKCFEVDPESFGCLTRRAISHLACDEIAAAKLDLDKAIVGRPNLPDSYYHRALVNWRLGNIGAAISDFIRYQRSSWYRPQGQSHHSTLCSRKHGFLDATSVAILLPTLVLLALIIAAAHKKHLFPWQEPLEINEHACKHCGCK